MQVVENVRLPRNIVAIPIRVVEKHLHDMSDLLGVMSSFFWASSDTVLPLPFPFPFPLEESLSIPTMVSMTRCPLQLVK